MSITDIEGEAQRFPVEGGAIYVVICKGERFDDGHGTSVEEWRPVFVPAPAAPRLVKLERDDGRAVYLHAAVVTHVWPLDYYEGCSLAIFGETGGHHGSVVVKGTPDDVAAKLGFVVS